jgi:hypothetical protein
MMDRIIVSRHPAAVAFIREQDPSFRDALDELVVAIAARVAAQDPTVPARVAE